MKSISMLIYKDLSQQRQRLLLGVVMLVIFGTQLRWSPNTGITTVASLLTGLLTVTAMGVAYDDDHGGLLFLRSLPLSPGTIVAGKFVALLAFACVYTVSALLPAFVFGSSRLPLSLYVLSLITATGAGLALAGIMLAVFYRYGYRYIQLASQYVVLGLVGIGFIINLVVQNLPRQGAPMWLESIIKGIAVWVSYDVRLTTLAFFLLGAFVYFALGCLAASNLRKRDL